MRGDLSDFRQQLLAWFDDAKRDLPWRQDPSVYKTVVSELMLQQTQVRTVIPYFHNWVRLFPDFASLAAADEASVLKAWEGLGYYSRARNLHRMAKAIAADGIPADLAGWRALPGIGPYTAAAIGSIAQGIAAAVVDGNVVRILARLDDDPTPVDGAATAQRHFGPRAAKLLDSHRPGAYNEAVMELGATICKKAAPACLLCPVQAHCDAFANGTAHRLPVIPPKASRNRVLHRAWIVCHASARILLNTYGPNASRLVGISELPELLQPPETAPILTRSRSIGNNRFEERIHPIAADDPLAAAISRLPGHAWHPADSLQRVTISAPHKKWIEQLLAQTVMH